MKRRPSERGKRGRPPVAAITEPQRRTLNVIRRFIAEHGYPPTIQEVGEAQDITTASAHEQVRQLLKKDYLRREPGKARSLEIVREPEREISTLVPVQVVGTVAAGAPILAVENVVGEILVEARLVGSARCFALEIDGDSMTGAGIQDGDYVIVRQQPVAENGDIVVALLGDDATVKRLYIADDRIELRPENPRHRPRSVGPDDEFSIQGKVIAVRRSSTPLKRRE